MITESRTIELATIPLGGMAGGVWNRLHAEREEVCEALLKQQAGRTQQADEQRDVLQARLRSIDHALDELMSSSLRW